MAESYDNALTRVNLVSEVASVFDPLGTTSPLFVRAKIRLRSLDGLKGLEWNDVIIGDDETWWRCWFLDLDQLNTLKIPRCLFPEEAQIVDGELHTFCDASEEPFASVVYIRVNYSDGRVFFR